jgi:iron complex outermembrane receptor protein
MKPLFTLLFVALISTLFQPALYAQSQINGSVKNKEGEALVGATLVIKGTNAFTVADLEGRFSLPVKVSLPLVLNVSSVGYTPQDLSLTELPQDSLRLILADDNELAEIVITSRRREETAQQVPIPISVIAGKLIADAGAFNVNRLKEMIPSVQLYSSNPRNTTLNVRGLGSTFGLTNDGIDPGVGFYVDGVYYARPAATTLDFVDIEQIEVLRGPQGTLFGKNTTAGAFNIRTAAPSFKTGGTFEVSYGNYGFIQAKSSITGGLGKKFAGRLSFSGTQRDGVLFNVRSQKYTNDLNNLGLRAQLLFNASSKVQFTLISDLSSQRPDGYALLCGLHIASLTKLSKTWNINYPVKIPLTASWIPIRPGVPTRTWAAFRSTWMLNLAKGPSAQPLPGVIGIGTLPTTVILRGCQC